MKLSKRLLAALVAVAAPLCAQTNSPPATTSAPQRFVEEEIAVAVEGAMLAATLTMPDGQGAYPAAILLSVAGPNDRDQSVGRHKGYRDFARHLARNGIASIRMDDRGAGGSTGSYFDSSWETLADDAAAAYDLLCLRPDIDCERIGFIGMSQGGAVGAMASRLRPGTAFVVLLSAPGLNGIEALRAQLDTTIRLHGLDEATANGYRASFDRFVGIVASDEPDQRADLLRFLQGPGRALIPPYGFVPNEDAALADMLLGDWYGSNINFNAAATYGELDVPVLAIGGTLDPVAPPDLHLAAIGTILAGAPTTQVAVETIEHGNHLLQRGQTGLPAEYGTIEHAIAPETLDAVSTWLTEVIGAAAR